MTTDATTRALRRPYLDDGDVRVYAGDCIEVMAELPAESVDAVVCDPPYGLEFMGREWDSFGADTRQRGDNTFKSGDRRHGLVRHGVGGSYGGDSRRAMAAFQAWCTEWACEALRVLKPGGHLIAFGGTRTFHRLTCGLEDAGFEIRDCLSFLYGSGFPKSLSPYRDQGKRLCQSIESAPHAVRLSEWLPLASDGVKGPTALAIAEMLPGGGLALLTRTGEADGSSVTTVTPSSVFRDATGISLSTDSSWSECSAVVLNGTNTSITETAARLTTDPRTLRFFSSVTTPPTITPAPTRPGGCSCDACTVVESSSDGVTRWSATPVLTAPAVATSRLAPLEPLGSALKPGWEPAVLARKPLSGTVAQNVQTHGTGALNIDGCRIAADAGYHALDVTQGATARTSYNPRTEPRTFEPASGRWPANVVLDEAAARQLDDQTGEAKPKPERVAIKGGNAGALGAFAGSTPGAVGRWPADPGGGPSRFFKVVTSDEEDQCHYPPAGASTVGASSFPSNAPVGSAQSDAATPRSSAAGQGSSSPARFTSDTGNAGVQNAAIVTPQTPTTDPVSWLALPHGERTLTGSRASDAEPNGQTATTTTTSGPRMSGGFAADATSGSTPPWVPGVDAPGSSRTFYTAKASTSERNNGHGPDNTHPTVKPLDLMRWLVRLVTPPGGLVLDPFAGSGTTGVAARAEGMRCVLIEREAEYLGIIAGRLSQLSLFGDAA